MSRKMIKVTNIRKATLNEATHTYTDANGIEATFSISTIAQRGGLKHISKSIQAAAEAGSVIHGLMHKIITKNTDKDGVVSFDGCIAMSQSTAISKDEASICIQYFMLLKGLKFKRPVVSSECSFMAEFNGITVGGTPDLLVQDGDVLHILDFKTAKIEGFKKDYMLQLYGYSMFKPEATKIQCYSVHPEDIKPLFSNPIPAWITEEFEENLYFLAKDKKEISLPTNRKQYLSHAMNLLQEARQNKFDLSVQLKEIEAREKQLMENMTECIESLGIDNDTIFSSEDMTIEKTKSRRHYLSYELGLDKYYKCAVTEEYHLTLDGKKVKIKINNKCNEDEE